MISIYLALAKAGFYVFMHAQIALVMVFVLFGLLLWWLKPWRMASTAATVVVTPLLAVYAVLVLAAIVPVLRSHGSSQETYDPWLNLVVMFLLVIFLPAVFYYFLERLDRDREAAPNHPVAHKILDYIGMAFFMGFVLVTGFGNFFKPIAVGGSLSWHTLTLACICLAGMTLFLRLVLNSLHLVASTDNAYLKELKRYYPILLYIFLGSTALALVSLGLDTIQ